MAEIRCPKCKEVFQVDDSDYAQIVTQIRDKEFEKEIARRENELIKASEKEVEIALLKQEQEQEMVVLKMQNNLSYKIKEKNNFRSVFNAQNNHR